MPYFTSLPMPPVIKDRPTLTPFQVTEARRLLNWSRNRLAGASGLGHDVIKRFEETGEITKAMKVNDTTDRVGVIKHALEEAGVSFEGELVRLMWKVESQEQRPRQYTIILVGSDGLQQTEAESFRAESDARAVQHANRLISPKTGAEVWQSYRKVALLPPR